MKSILKSIGYIIFYIVFQMVIMSVTSMAVGAAGRNKEQVELFMSHHMMLLVLISNILTIIVVGIFMKIRRKNILKELNIRKAGMKQYFRYYIIAFTFSMIFALLTYGVSFGNSSMIKTSTEYYSNIMPYLGSILQFVTLFIAAPITEEIICRGLILTTLQKQYGKMVSVILSAALFGLLHISAGGIILVSGSFVMGVILGVICVKANSLLPAIFAHMIANIPDFIIPLLPDFM